MSASLHDAKPGAGSARAIHATAIVLGEAGIVIRGASGSGKSSLALAVIELAGRAERFARLVGDDRVYVHPVNGRLVVSGHPAIAGRIEQRLRGILQLPYERKAIVRLVVDLVDEGCGIPPRLPEPADLKTQIAETPLARLALRAGAVPAESAARILGELARLGSGP